MRKILRRKERSCNCFLAAPVQLEVLDLRRSNTLWKRAREEGCIACRRRGCRVLRDHELPPLRLAVQGVKRTKKQQRKNEEKTKRRKSCDFPIHIGKYWKQQQKTKKTQTQLRGARALRGKETPRGKKEYKGKKKKIRRSTVTTITTTTSVRH